jgi:hypothetical protein
MNAPRGFHLSLFGRHLYNYIIKVTDPFANRSGGNF